MPDEYKIQWSLRPGSGDPDLINIRGDDAEEVMDLVRFVRNAVSEDEDLHEAASQVARQVARQAGANSGEEAIVKYELGYHKSGKLELSLYGVLGNGQTMQYPFLRHWGDVDEMRAMLIPVDEDLDWDNIPVSKNVTWMATWQESTNTNRKGEPYKDLVSVRQGA